MIVPTVFLNLGKLEKIREWGNVLIYYRLYGVESVKPAIDNSLISM